MTITNIGGIAVENRPYPAAELMALLHIDNRVKFWRAYHRAKPRPVIELGPKSIILSPEATVAFIKFFTISRETEAEDRKRIADKRRTS